MKRNDDQYLTRPILTHQAKIDVHQSWINQLKENSKDHKFSYTFRIKIAIYIHVIYKKHPKPSLHYY